MWTYTGEASIEDRVRIQSLRDKHFTTVISRNCAELPSELSSDLYTLLFEYSTAFKITEEKPFIAIWTVSHYGRAARA